MAHNISRVGLLGSLLILAAAAAGCQRGATWNLALVERTVTKAGRPLRFVEVVFLADLDAGTAGPRARGITDVSGHYRLRTDNGDDGAMVGKHLVCIHEIRGVKPEQALPPRLQKETASVREVAKEQERSRFEEAASASPRVPAAYGIELK